jgi:hypothetical protein
MTKAICGGYIDRVDPRTKPEEQYALYQNTLAEIDSRKDKVRPFNNLWPKYRDQNEFIGDYIYTVWGNPEYLEGYMAYIN